MEDNIIKITEEKFLKSISVLKNEFSKFILDKANFSLIENIKIPYYGQKCPIIQIAVISNEGSNTIIIKPFNKKDMSLICNEIVNLNLDLNPFVTNDYIKIIFPKLTSERREFFVKKTKKIGEDIKISIRNIRKQTNQKIKLDLKNKKLSQDDEKILLNEIDTLTNKYIDIINSLLNKKEKDLMTF